MVWKNLQRLTTGSPSGPSVSSSTRSLNRLSSEKPRIDSNVLIKIHYKEITYRMRFDLSGGHRKLRKRITMKLSYPGNEIPLLYGYVDRDFNLICIKNTEDLMGCKKYAESQNNTDYIRLVVYDSEESRRTIIRDYKNMETLRKGDLSVAKRTRIPPQPNPSQCGEEEFNECQNLFEAVTIIEGIVSTQIIKYEFKDGYDGLLKAVSSKFKNTESYFLAYFDRYSALTLLQNTKDLNESYSWMFDNRNIVLYYFPLDHIRKAYQHHCQEVNKRRRTLRTATLDEKQDSLPPPEYHTLSDIHMDAGENQDARHFKIGWGGDNVLVYGFFKYNPHNGIFAFKDIVREKSGRRLDQTLGYFDEDMDSIMIDTDEDLEECARAVKGPIIIFEVLNWQVIRKAHRLCSEEVSKIQQEDRNYWDNYHSIP